MIDAAELILTPAEVRAIAGGYCTPGRQLRELHALGFYRARIGKVSGQVILERAHYDAVATSAAASPESKAPRPRVRPAIRRVK